MFKIKNIGTKVKLWLRYREQWWNFPNLLCLYVDIWTGIANLFNFLYIFRLWLLCVSVVSKVCPHCFFIFKFVLIAFHIVLIYLLRVSFYFNSMFAILFWNAFLKFPTHIKVMHLFILAYGLVMTTDHDPYQLLKKKKLIFI